MASAGRMITGINMVSRKIKFEIIKGSLRMIYGGLYLVENTLDDNYNLIKSEVVETLHEIKFNYEWINREKADLFREVEAWKDALEKVKHRLEAKEIRSNEICLIFNPRHEVELKNLCTEVQKDLNKKANESVL